MIVVPLKNALRFWVMKARAFTHPPIWVVKQGFGKRGQAKLAKLTAFGKNAAGSLAITNPTKNLSITGGGCPYPPATQQPNTRHALDAKRLLFLIEVIYDAALQPESWPAEARTTNFLLNSENFVESFCLKVRCHVKPRIFNTRPDIKTEIK